MTGVVYRRYEANATGLDPEAVHQSQPTRLYPVHGAFWVAVRSERPNIGTFVPSRMSTKVSESTGYVPNLQMSAFGYVIAAVLVIFLLPALPIIALAWVLWRVFVADESSESSYERWRAETADRQSPNAPNASEDS